MSNLDLTIAEIMHGDTEVLKIMKGDVQKWPYVPYDSAVECIKATGTQHVTFSVSVAAGNEFGVVLDFVNKTTGTGKNLLKDQRSGNFQYKMTTYSHNDATNVTTFSTTVGTKSQADGVGGGIQVPDNERCVIELSTTKKKVNDTETAIARPLTNTISSLSLLGSGLSADIYGMRVYKNGTDILNLIPVRVDGVGKLFDKVSGEIKGTYTGTFTYGNDV